MFKGLKTTCGRRLAAPVIAAAIAVTACGGALSQFVFIVEAPEKVALAEFKLELQPEVRKNKTAEPKPESSPQKKENRPIVLKPVSDCWDLASNVYFEVPALPLAVLPPEFTPQLPLDRLSIGFSLANHDPTLPPGRGPPQV